MINPASLPRVPIGGLSSLPNAPGLYFAFAKGQILYIGIAGKSLRQRWVNHHRRRDLARYADAEIAYFELRVSRHQLLKIESHLIGLYSPPLNGAPVFSKAKRKGRVKPSDDEDIIFALPPWYAKRLIWWAEGKGTRPDAFAADIVMACIENEFQPKKSNKKEDEWAL